MLYFSLLLEALWMLVSVARWGVPLPVFCFLPCWLLFAFSGLPVVITDTWQPCAQSVVLHVRPAHRYTAAGYWRYVCLWRASEPPLGLGTVAT